jgi:DNA polymerase-4
VGPKTLEKLRRIGVDTVADLASLDERAALAALGAANGAHLRRLAHGVDNREVVPDQRPKSIGHEETFARDHHRLETLRQEAVRLGDSVAARLRSADMAGRTVSIKVRFHDFSTITRSITLPSPVDTGNDVVRAATELLDKIDPTPGVRLLGIHISQLVEGAARQLTLDDVDAPSWDDATDAIDAIRARYGAGAIVPASLAGPEGIRVKRRGDQQWGPSELSGPSSPEP